jgi:ribosomal protein S12 methylthiotransferase accessory factor
VDAAPKSLEELAHTRRYCQWVKTHVARLAPDPPKFECVVDQLTHLGFYVDHANLHYASFLFASDLRVDFETMPNLSTGNDGDDLSALAAAVAATGDRALVADLTTADVASLGLTVVRAVVPGYQPLHMGFHLRATGGRRLYEVPRRLGYEGIEFGGPDNGAPHPYP